MPAPPPGWFSVFLPASCAQLLIEGNNPPMSESNVPAFIAPVKKLLQWDHFYHHGPPRFAKNEFQPKKSDPTIP